jgi:hypothetical protein
MGGFAVTLAIFGLSLICTAIALHFPSPLNFFAGMIGGSCIANASMMFYSAIKG